MKTKRVKPGMIAGFIAFAGLAITAIAWQDSTVLKSQQQKIRVYQDTVPREKYQLDIEMKDLDKAMKEVDKAMEKVNKELKEIDWNKINLEVDAAIKKIDLDKIKLDIEKSIKDVNWEKINQEIKESMSKVDWEKMRKEINESMDQVKKIDLDKIKIELDKVKDINLKEIKVELDKVKQELEANKGKIKIDVQVQLDKAKEELKAAKSQLAETKEMIDELEKDGLIDKSADITIELKDKDLYINDKKQPSSVTEKYRKYFKGDSYKIRLNK